MGYQLRIIKGSNKKDWAPLKTDWNALAEQKKFPLMRYEWCISAAQTLTDSDNVFLITIYQQKKVVAIAPLAEVKKRKTAILEVIGSSILGEPCGLLFADLDAFKALIRGIISLKKPVRLSKVDNNLFSKKEFKSLARKRLSFTICRPASPSPFIEIGSSWIEFNRRMTAKRRYDLRRARKRAEMIGKVEFEFVRPKPYSLKGWIEKAFDIEAKSWKGRVGSAMKLNELLGSFYRAYARYEVECGNLLMAFMSINGAYASMVMGVEYGNRFWVLKVGYDEMFSKCSPGVLLMHETIGYAFQQKLDSFEFLGTDAPWLRMWSGNNLREHQSYAVFPSNLKTLFVLYHDTIQWSKRKLIRLLNLENIQRNAE